MQFDIIIAGGGPAGCTAALALAGKGLKVAVIEKNTFPRDKICGGALAAYIPKVLNTINPDFKSAFEAFPEKIPADTCRIIAPNFKIIDFNVGQTGYISTREKFDTFLYELAAKQTGIQFFLNQTVRDVVIQSESNEVSVTTESHVFNAKLIIGCDGANSITSKKLTSTRPDRKHSCMAVRGIYENVSGFEDRTFELHFLKDTLPGYFWMFPLPGNRANIGLGMLSQEISRNKLNLRQIMLNCIEKTPGISKRFQQATLLTPVEGYVLPLGSRKVQMSGPNFMLCGDAASLINPLSGEGIGQAMVSGRYAGWQALECFEKNDFSAKTMQNYDRQVYAKFWKANQKSYRIQQFFLNRTGLMNSVVNLASNNEFIRQLIVKIAT